MSLVRAHGWEARTPHPRRWNGPWRGSSPSRAPKKGGGSGGGGGGGGGGNGGGGQQQKPADDGEEQAPAAPNADDASPAEGNKDKEHEKGKDGDKEKDQQEKGAKGKDKDGKKPPPMVTAVLKVDMHCDGCAKRIHGSVHRYPGKKRNAITQSRDLSFPVCRRRHAIL